MVVRDAPCCVKPLGEINPYEDLASLKILPTRHWSRSSDLELFGRRSSDRHGDLKIPARWRCDLKIARSAFVRNDSGSLLNKPRQIQAMHPLEGVLNLIMHLHILPSIRSE